MGLLLVAVGGIAFIAYAIGGITLLIESFKKSVGTGLLCLFIPFYIFYFAFAQYKAANKKQVLIFWIGGFCLFMACNSIGTFMKAAPEFRKVSQKIQENMLVQQEEAAKEAELGELAMEDEVIDNFQPPLIVEGEVIKGLEPELITRDEEPVQEKGVISKLEDIIKNKFETVKSKSKEVVREIVENTGPNPDTIYLKNKDVITGKIIKETADIVVVKVTMSSGYAILEFNKNTEVEKIESSSR